MIPFLFPARNETQNRPNCVALLQARLWVQVIHELRHGVKLKKVDNCRTPIEYELTPYEILMDDIRSRRYKLNKVMVDGDIPHRIKKDAHAIILEFIRSRPPLRKVRGTCHNCNYFIRILSYNLQRKLNNFKFGLTVQLYVEKGKFLKLHEKLLGIHDC
jgi:hypothetical protein